MGETNTYKTKPLKKDEDGHVILEPRNFTTKKCKTGRMDAVYFDKPSYVSVEDPYKHKMEKIMRDEVKDGHKGLHDVKFKPAKHVKERYYTASYEHMNERVEVKKDYRDGDGNVVLAPKNFYTMPAKNGQSGKRCYFNGQVEHMPDDYNWPKKLARQEMEEGKKLEQEKPFSQKAKEIGLFNPNKEIYDVRTDIPAKPRKQEMKPPMEQEVPFKPSKPPRRGYSCTLEKFPAYMENPLKFTERKRPVEGEEKPPAFKSATHFKSRPMPSVVTNMRNMKASFPSVFRK